MDSNIYSTLHFELFTDLNVVYPWLFLDWGHGINKWIVGLNDSNNEDYDISTTYF